MTFLIWGYVDFHDAAFRIQKILKEHTGKSYGGVWLKQSVEKEGLRAAWHQLKSWEKEIFMKKRILKADTGKLQRTGGNWKKRVFSGIRIF